MNNEPEDSIGGRVIAAKDIEWESKDYLPYDQFDPEIVELCKTINEFPGIVTTSSCQGFLNDHQPDQPWHIFFQFDGLPTLEGYASLEFLIYIRRGAIADGFDLEVGVDAALPAANGVCQSMYYFYECANRHPTQLSTFIRSIRDKLFYIPDTRPV
jgi:hypothetical protein